LNYCVTSVQLNAGSDAGIKLQV